MAAVNPKMLTPLPLRYMLAENSKTWDKGTPCILTSGTVTPLTTSGSTAVYGLFAEDQDESTSSSYVWVYVLEEGALLEVYVETNGTATAIGTANLGTKYGLELGTGTLESVGYLDLGTASGQFQVARLSAVYEPELNEAADAPGKCIVKFTAIS